MGNKLCSHVLMKHKGGVIAPRLNSEARMWVIICLCCITCCIECGCNVVVASSYFLFPCHLEILAILQIVGCFV